MPMTPLRLEHIDGRRWTVIEPFTYMMRSGRMFKVEAGFITDFASVPRAFWRLIPPTGTYSPAAVVHDWLYRHNGVTRTEADGIFRDIMAELGVGWLTRQTMWAAVRVGAGGTWDRYRREDKDALGVGA